MIINLAIFFFSSLLLHVYMLQITPALSFINNLRNLFHFSCSLYRADVKMYLKLLLILLLKLSMSKSNSYGDYQFIFNPENYMEQLPSLSMPYINNIKIPKPNLPINPTPAIRTKVINVVTQYVNKNPVCIKVSGRKPPCPYKNSKNNLEYIVTKEYFVQDKLPNSNLNTTNTNKKTTKKKNKRKKNKRRRIPSASVASKIKNFTRELNEDEILFDVEPSESGRSLRKNRPTPVLNLSNSKIREILIEDRLDQLEEILPHYTRKRNYETSTITVTKVLYNSNKQTATLLVKNCVPPDIAICPKRRRKTKDLQFSDED